MRADRHGGTREDNDRSTIVQNKQGVNDGDNQMLTEAVSDEHQTVSKRRWVEVLKHRWPTALGVVVGLVAASDVEIPAGSISSLAALPVIMALVYLGAAVLGRRFAWPILLVGFVALIVLRSFSTGLTLMLIFLVAGLSVLVLGVVRRQGRARDGLPLQTLGMLIFGALPLATLAVSPTLSASVIGVAILGHGAWDIFHLLRNRVVVRSYAEFCAVFDLLLGAAILVVA
jgi:hypothetical protein